MNHAERVKCLAQKYAEAVGASVISATYNWESNSERMETSRAAFNTAIDEMQSALDDAVAKLAARDAEVATLHRWKSTNAPRLEALQGLLKTSQKEAHAGFEAVATLASEREANSILTAEVERLRKPEGFIRLALMHAAFDVPSGMKVGELREAAVKLFGAKAVDAALSEEVKGGE